MRARALPSRLLGAVDLLVAAAIPFLVLAVLCASSWLDAYGEGTPTRVLGLLLGLVGFFGGFFSLMLYLRFASMVEFFFAGLVSFMVLGGAYAIADRITEDALLNRGVAVTCELLDVASRTITTTTHDADGTTSSSTRTVYDHTLDCPGDGPTAMTLGYGAGAEGESVEVAYDPRARIDPVPSDSLPTGAPSPWPWWVLSAAAVLRVGHVAAFLVLSPRSRRR
ncbi:hypothetical protein Q8791_27815 [Nocardiopsis sp. CT-R113]|uniref:DUF3592 domain-containing protein n=1 Tax=Nocardiopsis codii TaxID=3065942 RepID=A0ABU7KFM9_9ACTN|nr:hypothetical protein [Nocardiopsis sp. CT-R113]MEE2041035.1 hypothetical protein [Nocardiopsis sp. CT-R113]